MIQPAFPVTCTCGYINKTCHLGSVKCIRCDRTIPALTVDRAYEVDQSNYRPSLVFADIDTSQALIERVFGCKGTRPNASAVARA